MPEFSDYIVFVDESGDHGLLTLDPSYPVFVLALCLFAKEDYASVTAPAVMRLKFKHFGHDHVILHEHEIRKAKGDFRFLTNAGLRLRFYEDLNALVDDARFTLVASAIHKARLLALRSTPDNPYHVALDFGLEQIFLHLQGLGCRSGVTHMVFEKRGAREDAELEAAFRRVCNGGNVLRRRFPFEIIMADKKCNSAGLQLADLVARPVGRHILDRAQPNRAYDILARKFRRAPDGSAQGCGLKVFP